MDEIRVVARHALASTATTQTGGMGRLEAIAADGVRVIEVHTMPGSVSGWHHHGTHSTYGYVIAGRLRLEYGPEGGRVIDAEAGDFFFVPPDTVHRESNPAAEEQVLVGFRVGDGPTVFNVDGPDGS